MDTFAPAPALQSVRPRPEMRRLANERTYGDACGSSFPPPCKMHTLPAENSNGYYPRIVLQDRDAVRERRIDRRRGFEGVPPALHQIEDRRLPRQRGRR